MTEKTDLQKKLEEQFQALLPEADAPIEVKKEVFRTLDLLEVAGDIADLFTDKFGKTSAQALDFLDTDTSDESK